MAKTGIIDRLREIREHLGDSQRSVAKRLEIAQITWNGYERGVNLPNPHVLLRLRSLGFNPTWVLTGEGQMQLPKGGGQYGGFDRDLFCECWVAIEEVLDDMKKRLARDRRMALVFEVYDLEVLERSKRGSVSAARILQMVRAAK